MSRIPEDKIKEITDKATLFNVLKDYHNFSKKRGSNYVMPCKKCGGEEKLQFNEAKELASCFSCNIKIGSAVSYLMNFHDLAYIDAIREMARIETIDIVETTKKPKKHKRPTAKQLFRDKKLAESGLTIADVTGAIPQDDDTEVETCFYKAGTFDERYQPDYTADDIIIEYYDLHGKPMQYYAKTKGGNATGSPKDFMRVRYQNPELHKDRYGNATKYKSPYGSDTKVYIPKKLRQTFKMGNEIETLYIQEGELKADKACKHGMLSVGIMGIHNIAYNKTLPKEFEMIIKRCNVKKVVFVLDQDWLNLSSKIDAKHPADSRPKSFFRAVVNFRDYFYAFTNNDIFLDIFFAHINDNKAKDKGLDDLLTNTLKGKEDQLVDLCDKAMLKPTGDAVYLTFHKITTVSEHKLKEFWGLENNESFINQYKDELINYPVFRLGRVKYRFNEHKEAELAQPIREDEQYWKEIQTKGDTAFKFRYKRSYTFFENRGYFKYAQPKNKHILVHINDQNVVKEVEPQQLRDFINEFTDTLSESEDLQDMLYAGGSRYFGADSLSNLRYANLNILKAEKGIQYMYFNDLCWKITEKGIEQEDLKHITGHLWESQIKDFNPEFTELFKELHQITPEDVEANKALKKEHIGEWTFDFTEAGEKSHLLSFFVNTSDLHHKNRTRSFDTYDLDEKFETTRNTLSKLTAIGYLLHNYRDASVAKAVVGMDSIMSEVGLSNGRSGKSLIGMFLEKINDVEFIAGKRKDLLDDKFLFDGVDERKNNVWIDDVRINFDLELLFPHITGKFIAEKKGLGKVTLDNPIKMYITTNHAMKGGTSSYKDRQLLLGFSDWYNDKHKPIDDFGMNFWSEEWPIEQWNLFYSLAATCLQLYFKHGIIEAPTERLEQRRLRQAIGENFLSWAEQYFSNPNNLNTRIPKDEMYRETSIEHGEGFGVKNSRDVNTYVTPTDFKRRLKNLCIYKNWEFNPTKKGGDWKSGGVEYLEVGVSDEYYKSIVADATTRALTDSTTPPVASNQTDMFNGKGK